MNKARIKLFEDYYERRMGGTPPQDFFQLGVNLSTWLHSWVDECADLIESKKTVSPTKHKAYRRLVPLLEDAYGKRFDAPPKKLKPIDGGYRDIYQSPNDNQGEAPMKDKTTKKSAPAAATKKKAAAPAKKKLSVTAQKVAAKKSGAATAPAAKVEKEEVGKRGRAASYSDDQKITLVEKTNPKRAGTDAHKRYEYYKTCKTVGEFVKKGGSYADLRWDAEREYITIK